MSTKFIGVSVMAAGCLTAAVAGYVVLREPVSVPQVAVSAPANPAMTLPTQPVVTTPNPPQTARPSRPSAPASPAAKTQPEVVLPPTPPALPTPPTPARYIPDPPAPVPTVVPVPAPAGEPAAPLTEVTVERNSVIGIRLDFGISTKTARIEDRVVATVIREVTVNGRVAIPLGARLEGTVTAVDRGGRFRERSRLGLRFDTVILTDGTRLSISTDTIVREGDAPSADATARVGAGAVAGAILGGVLGGKKGAILGGIAGAGGGAATVMTGDGHETSLREGAPLTVRLTEDLTVLIQR